MKFVLMNLKMDSNNSRNRKIWLDGNVYSGGGLFNSLQVTPRPVTEKNVF